MNKYNGEDILEVMKLAKNYNNYLLNLIYCNIYKHKSSVICDFGSGTGYLSNELSKLIKKDIICVENAYNLQKYYKLDNLILKHDLIELEDNFLDFIYSLNVLEHIEDDIEIIDLFYKKIRENGIIFLYLPAYMCLYSSMDKKVGHFRRYNKKELLKRFDTDKFEVLKIEYADFAGFFVTLLYKLIGSKNGNINVKLLKFFDRFIFPIGLMIDKITKGKFLGKNIFIVARKK